MQRPTTDIIEAMGQLAIVANCVDRWCQDDEEKNEIRHTVRELQTKLQAWGDEVRQFRMRDQQAALWAQSGISDVIIPECINTPTMQKGLHLAIIYGGLAVQGAHMRLRHWNERQLGYFIMQLHPFEKGTMPNNELCRFFEVANLSKAISAYLDTARQKPNGYEAVDKILREIA